MSEQQDALNAPQPGAGAATAGAPGPAQAESAAQPEVMPGPEELLRRAELQAAEHYDAWLRAKADAENIRKRGQEEVTKAHKFAVEGFSREMLAVKDSLEAALGVQNQTAESLRGGVELTLRQLNAVFEKFSVAAVEPAAGEKFDPHRHQAMTTVESDQAPNTIVQVFQKGYLLHDRVLRPALVSVAKARAA